MKQVYFIALAICLTSLSGWVLADQASADQVMMKCKTAAAEDEIPGPELTGYLRQCMADAGLSDDEIDVRTGQGGPAATEESAPTNGESD